SIELPSSKVGFKVDKGMAGVKAIVPKVKENAALITEVAAALKLGKGAELSSAVDKAESVLPLVHKMTTTLCDELDVTYLLLTHVVGDEAAWEAKKEVTLAAALVNAKTGKLRYFATTKAK